MPNAWASWVRTEQQGQLQNGTQHAYPQTATQEEYPPHAEGPNLQREAQTPNQSPVPENHHNPVVIIPEWPEWRTERDKNRMS